MPKPSVVYCKALRSADTVTRLAHLAKRRLRRLREHTSTRKRSDEIKCRAILGKYVLALHKTDPDTNTQHLFIRALTYEALSSTKPADDFFNQRLMHIYSNVGHALYTEAMKQMNIRALLDTPPIRLAVTEDE